MRKTSKVLYYIVYVSYVNLFFSYTRLAEYLLGYLVKLGVVSDAPKSEKEYFASSAQKLYSPAQVQLALILLQEGKIKDGLGWLKKATDLVRIYLSSL